MLGRLQSLILVHVTLMLMTLTRLACAAEPSEHGFSLGVARGEMAYQSVERSTAGGVINQEQGYLPLIVTTVGWQSVEGWSLHGRYSRAKGDVAYQGYTQIGIPLSTQTQLAVHQTELQWRDRWPVSGSLSWQPNVGVSHVRVDRNIQPALGSLPLQEVLDSTRLAAGMSLHQRWSRPEVVGSMRPMQWSVGVDVLTAVRNRLAVNSFGQFDPITLAPARQTDWRWHAHAQWALSEHAMFSMGVVQERLQPGGSAVEVWRRDGVPVAGVRYPGSQQHLRQWTVGLDWRF